MLGLKRLKVAPFMADAEFKLLSHTEHCRQVDKRLAFIKSMSFLLMKKLR